MSDTLKAIAREAAYIINTMDSDNDTLMLATGQTVELLSDNGTTRLVVMCEGRVYKLDCYDGDTCRREWEIWNEVKDTALGRFFVPVLDYCDGVIEMEYVDTDPDVHTARTMRNEYDRTAQANSNGMTYLARCDDWDFNISADGRFLDYAAFYNRPMERALNPNGDVNF